jgi:hypothetical protein
MNPTIFQSLYNEPSNQFKTVSEVDAFFKKMLGVDLKPSNQHINNIVPHSGCVYPLGITQTANEMLDALCCESV